MERMYKILLVALHITSASGLCAQTFDEVDRKVRQYPHFTVLEDLGIRIRNDFGPDSLRIRAAFVWVTANIAFEERADDSRVYRHRITYKSEGEKKEAIRDFVGSKIDQAFRQRKGVCIDYSLMLHALFEQFGLPSKVITGVAKTEIMETVQDPTFRNHSWNAVQVGGEWKLMDPTWATGYVDSDTGKFTREFKDHYFFTEPEDFILHHLPANPEWQLLDQPVSSQEFYRLPILLPDFCEKGIQLSRETSGLLSLEEEAENMIFFDRLPEEHLMHYRIDDSPEMKRMGLKKDGKNGYQSRIRLRRKFNRPYERLTVYLNEEPVLRFHIREGAAGNQETDARLFMSKKR